MFLYISCNKQEQNTVYIGDFPKEEHVEARAVDWIDAYQVSGILHIDSFLIVLNQKGNALKQYLISNALITDFTIDEANNRVFGYDPENENYSIVEFDL